MCGHFGILGNDIYQMDMEVFLELGMISTLRGQDGTGIFQGRFWSSTIKDKNTFFIEKSSGEVNNFLRYHRYNENRNKLLFNIYDNIHAGHVRWATKGAVVKSNSHPFDAGRIVGMHNGTLKEKEYDDTEKTDSELFIQDIQKRGVEEVLSGLDKDSAYAIVLIDKETGEVTFARNKHRPLHCAFSKTRNVLYYASEYAALEYILDRKGIIHDGVKTFGVDEIYKIFPYKINHKNIGFGSVAALPVKTKIFSVPNIRVKDKRGHVPANDPFGITTGEGTNEVIDSTEDAWEYFGENYGQHSPWVDPAIRVAEAENREREAAKALESLTWPAKKGKKNNTAGADNGKPKILEFKKVDTDPLNPLAPKKFVFGRSKKIPYEYCFSCGQEMNLVSQHFAEKVEVEGQLYYDCSECVRTAKDMKDSVHVPTIN